MALKKKDFDERTVATLSKLIPQNILFVLEFEGQSKLAIYHTKLMQTNWKPTESCTIEPRGLNLDKVWENIVVDIGGVSIADGNTLDEQIAADERRQKIEKEITKLEKQARAEKQPKKKFELVQQIKKAEYRNGETKMILGNIASVATLILFVFYFIGRIITIVRNRYVFTDELRMMGGRI